MSLIVNIYTATASACTTDGLNLSQALDALFPARTEWYYIGLSLGLESDDLDSIKIEQRENCKDCLMETLKCRLKTGKPLTFDDLIEMLKKPTVGRTERALKLQQVGVSHDIFKTV